MAKKHRFFLRFCSLFVAMVIGIGTITPSSVLGADSTPAVEMKNPGILPISPFYFLKKWRRSVIRSFTKDPLSQAVFELETLDEKEGELRKINELRSDDVAAVRNAIKNYNDSQLRLEGAMKEVDINDTEDAGNKEKLVQEVLKKIAEHKEYFVKLFDLYLDNETVSLLEKVQKTMLDIIKASKMVPEEKFNEITKKYFSEEINWIQNELFSDTVLTINASEKIEDLNTQEASSSVPDAVQ